MRPEVSIVEDLRCGVPIMDELHKHGVTSPYSRSPSPASSVSNSSSLKVLSDSNVAKSAFEITSVSDAPPDAEIELEGVPVSRETDDLQRSIREVVSEGVEVKTLPSASNGDQEGNELDSVTPTIVSTSEANSAATSTNPSPKFAHFALTGAAGNGPSQSARSRFKRVTQYQRGRWNGVDICEPEEHPESELKMANLPPSSRQTDVPAQSSSPTPPRRAILPISTVESLSMRSRNEPSNLLHSHNNSELSYSTDSKDAHLDRISVAVESTHSLSRTASMSSVVKLVDEEERELELDQDSVTSFALSTQTPDLVVTEAQLTNVERPQQLCSCQECSRGPQDRTAMEQQKLLGKAVNHLREQLSQCDSYVKILEDRNRLHEEKNRLQEENNRLRDLLASRGVNVPPPQPDTGQEHS